MTRIEYGLEVFQRGKIIQVWDCMIYNNLFTFKKISEKECPTIEKANYYYKDYLLICQMANKDLNIRVYGVNS